MSGNPLRLKVAYLYPDILHGLCDKANVETFKKRANWRDIDVTITEVFADDKIHSSKFDFYYIGGSDKDSLFVANKYIKQIQDELKIASSASVPILAVYIGYILFGKSWQLNNKEKIEGMGIFDIDSIENKRINYGNIVGKCDLTDNNIVVGFKNHNIFSYLNEKASYFLKVKTGFGNNRIDKTEGTIVKNTIGTYLTSPILAQNPLLCDYLITSALYSKYKCKIPLTELYDDIETYSRNYILKAN